MALLDSLKNLFKQGGSQVAAHKDQAHQAVQKVGDEVDKRTGGKYEGQVDSAQQKADDAINKLSGDEHGAPEGQGPGAGAGPA
jgi:TRAP-type C4-dicarboxylate transport system substrate-binding protein